MPKVFNFIWRHKILLLVVVVLLGVGGYFGYQKWFGAKTTVRYVTAAVARGDLTTEITGTGQVSMSDQVEVKPKVSGDVVSVKVVAGQEVKTGQILMQIDATDALKTVRDARTNLETAQLSLAKLKQPATELEVLQAENSLAAAKESKQQAEDTLAKSYDDGFNSVANAFLDLPSIMNGLNTLLYNNDIDSAYDNIDYYFNQIVGLDYDQYSRATKLRSEINSSYTIALASYEKNLDAYKAVTRESDKTTIESLIWQTYETDRLVSDAIKNVKNFLDMAEGVMSDFSGVTKPTLLTTHQNNLNTYTSEANGHLTSLLSIKNTINNTKVSITSGARSIAEKTASLADLKAGTDALDLRSQEISVAQKQNALADAQNTLADYTVRAPFDGIMATVDVKKGDSASAASAIGTLVTKQRIATITFNEVDSTKIKIGQKAVLTFDAVEGLTINGEVADMDTIGTVSQGVVSYNVTIKFDTQDERIKSGMSVNAAIITDSKTNVLTVLNSAVKTQGNINYVEVMTNGAPVKKQVTIGITDDVNTEIVSGVAEGDEVVTQTITSSGSNKSASTKSTTQSSDRSGGMGGIMGGPPM